MNSHESKYVLELDSEIARLVDALDADAREFYEERAGILEFSGKHARLQAESLAWDETKEYLKRRVQPNGR